MDRGWIVALVALKKEFLTADQFLAAFELLLQKPATDFDELLVAQEAITPSQRTNLKAYVHEKLKSEGLPWRSLVGDDASLSSLGKGLWRAVRKHEKTPEKILQKLRELLAEPAEADDAPKSERTTKGSSAEPAGDPYDTVDPYDTTDPHSTVIQ
jgi:hypothetical protein